jgi:hypothetical protein
VDVEAIRERVRDGKYLVRSHAITHALKEGFGQDDIVTVVLEGRVIEEYEAEQRFLICGKTSLSKNASIYLHVICEYSDDVYVEFITAYFPDESLWEKPPYKRREPKL